MRTAFNILLVVANVLIGLLYPVAIWYGLSRFGPREVGLIVLALVIPMAALRLRGKKREHVMAVLRAPLAIVGLVLLSIALDDARFILAMPVVISLVMLAWFAGSLRGEVSAIERFARLQVDYLSDPEVAYCRTVTKVWCGFLVLNATAAGALAIWAPVSWWALYTGLIAYVLMGAMFAVEYTVRKWRFRRYLGGPLDPFFRRIFPEPALANSEAQA